MFAVAGGGACASVLFFAVAALFFVLLFAPPPWPFTHLLVCMYGFQLQSNWCRGVFCFLLLLQGWCYFAFAVWASTGRSLTCWLAGVLLCCWCGGCFLLLPSAAISAIHHQKTYLAFCGLDGLEGTCRFKRKFRLNLDPYKP